MTLEQQVASLVTSTTTLTNIVNNEINKVRQENANFKASITDPQGQGKFQQLLVGHGGGSISNNTILSPNSLQNNTNGQWNTAIGTSALKQNQIGSYNVAVGANSLSQANSNYNVGVGYRALTSLVSGVLNVAIGADSLLDTTTGDANVGVGARSLRYNSTGLYNVAVGVDALSESVNHSGSVGLGYNAQVSGNNQVQLGSSSTTTYVFGTVQNRSDLRDKADVRNTILGLDFVKSLRPVDYRWDMREDYKPTAPQDPGIDATEQEKARYQSELQAWLESCKLKNITHNGTKKRRRFHHGLIAQEVKQVLDQKGIDFGGYQDHSIGGGDDVLSLGYDQFIAPLIKAVQELAQQNEALVARISALESK